MLTNLISDNGFNRLVKGRRGYILYNKNDIVVGRSIAEYGEYFESEVLLFSMILRPGNFALDVGANIGTHSIAMAQLVGATGRILAFEPQRAVFQLLCANMALNNLANADCRQMVLGAEMGEMFMPAISCEKAANFGGVSANTVGLGYAVPMKPLDSVLEGETVHFVKIDVEGMELDVLKGATQTITRCRPIIYLENDRVAKSEELISYLWSLGYEAYWHLPRFFDINNFAANPTNIHGFGIYEHQGDLQCIGFAINMLCLPVERGISVKNFRKVVSATEHPLRKGQDIR